VIQWTRRNLRSRKRLYEAGIGLVALAVAYGLVNGDEADAWMVALAALLGVARNKVPDGE
jgi:hypothetical protein